jgi:hypothetical protein
VLYHRPNYLIGFQAILLYWIARTWILAHRGLISTDPVDFALKDRAFWFSFVAAAALILFAA